MLTFALNRTTTGQDAHDFEMIVKHCNFIFQHQIPKNFFFYMFHMTLINVFVCVCDCVGEGTNEKVNTTEILAPIAGICLNLCANEQQRSSFVTCLAKDTGFRLETVVFLVAQHKWGMFLSCNLTSSLYHFQILDFDSFEN
jgi:hypothetical protein